MIYDINGNEIAFDTSVKTYYVATTGSDNNNGLTSETPLATVSKAIQKGAERIYVAPGTYTEFVRINKAKANFEIICKDWNNPAIFSGLETQGVSTRDFAFEIASCNKILMKNIKMIGGRLGACYIHDCYEVNMDRCEGSYCTAGMGFKLMGSCYVKFNTCKSNFNGIDGFNIHGASTIECYNCYAEGNLDDGFSNHESTKAVYENCIAIGNQNGITPVMGAETYVNSCIACDNEYNGLAFAGTYTGPITMRNCLSVRNNSNDYQLGGNSATWMYNYNNVDSNTFTTSSINRIPDRTNRIPILAEGTWTDKGEITSTAVCNMKTKQGIQTITTKPGYVISMVYSYPTEQTHPKSSSITGATMEADVSTSRTTYTTQDASKYYGITFTKTDSTQTILPTEDIIDSWVITA